MDKNSVIGILIIGALIIGYSLYTAPSEEQSRAMQREQDSIAVLQKAMRTKQEAENKQIIAPASVVDTSMNDSAKAFAATQQLGDFASAATGEEKIFSLENNLIKVNITSRGGRIKNVVLKNYKSFDGKPVTLLGDDSSYFNLNFPAQSRSINTKELFFEPSETNAASNRNLSLRLKAGDNKYVEYSYALPDDSYLLNFKINMVGLNDVISANATYLSFDWKDNVTKQESSIKNERMATTIYYRFADEDVDYIGYTTNESQSLKTKVKWISFKQQFFTSVLIADNAFDSPVVETKTDEGSDKFVKTLSAAVSFPYEHKANESYGMRFYFGPNHYQTLKKIDDLNLEKQIQLGWGIFGWVNQFIVIPIFNFLNSFNWNFGLIILILTIIIRVILLPLTYGSFKSQAKMKVLAPEIAEINEKYKDDAMKKQQETMAFYKRAGVNPLGGCIPGLLQMPILIAMFNFFPASIELRQQSFLWAHDLSTYDSILELGFNIPFYGDHVSLFTLLMTVSTLLFTRLNMQMTSAANPQMKWMMYLMPVLFLGVFNSYAAGLSYYYFLSNMIGLGQQYLFKYFIDEKAIHLQIQENKKRPAKAKSSFQQRLEKMAKERGKK